MLKSFVSCFKKSSRKPSWQTRVERTRAAQPERPSQGKIKKQKSDRKRRPERQERREKAAAKAAWVDSGKRSVEARAAASTTPL